MNIVEILKEEFINTLHGKIDIEYRKEPEINLYCSKSFFRFIQEYLNDSNKAIILDTNTVNTSGSYTLIRIPFLATFYIYMDVLLSGYRLVPRRGFIAKEEVRIPYIVSNVYDKEETIGKDHEGFLLSVGSADKLRQGDIFKFDERQKEEYRVDIITNSKFRGGDVLIVSCVNSAEPVTQHFLIAGTRLIKISY
jgi:hypothetical protein